MKMIRHEFLSINGPFFETQQISQIQSSLSLNAG
jgi:hypothetical protein